MPAARDAQLAPHVRLRRCAHRWRLLPTASWASRALREGVRLGFRRPPPAVWRPTRMPSDPVMAAELRRQVAVLVQKGTVQRVPRHRLRCASPLFLVPKKGGKWRLVHDLRVVNDSIVYRRFRLAGLQQVRQRLHQGAWMASVDLTDAYYHVPLHPADSRAVGFVVDGVPYAFQSLCFGLASAPRLFTKMLRPVVADLQRSGVQVSFYLDDGLVVADTPAACAAGVRLLLRRLRCLGFAVNTSKCHLQPTQRLEYLGVLLDTRRARMLLPAGKVRALRKDARRLAASPDVPLRQLAAFVGRANFAAQCLRLGRLHVHPMAQAVATAYRRLRRWSGRVRLPPTLRAHLRWWAGRMQRWNGAALLPPPPPAVTVETDASTLGWGASVANAPPALRRSAATVNGAFRGGDRALHITWKELFAATEGVTRLAKANGWRNLHVRVRTDATTVVPYLNKMGGRRLRLHARAAAFHHWCLRRGLRVSARHLAGVDNVTADALSRPQTRYGEHRLSRAAWRDLFPTWPPPVDLFATATTARSPRYMSRVRDPNAIATDAMSAPWPRGRLYAFPPLPLLLRLVVSLPSRLPRGARLTLLTPEWVSAPWYPLLLALARPQRRLSRRSIHGSPAWPWSVLVWELRA